MSTLSERALTALSKVIDPELNLPITELGMVGSITGSEQKPIVELKLTVSHCPQADYLSEQVRYALSAEFGDGEIQMSVMTKDELDALKMKLRGPNKANPFTSSSPTRVVLVGSGKGGVGKSTITANLAVGLAKQGYSVGLIDADIFGFSITQQLGVTDRPTRLDDMMLPPIAYGVKVISIGMFLSGNDPVSWRGPMLHKAIEQFLTDVYWGSLDFLLIDMPPGTGDVAISIGQLLPHAKALVVTTAATAAAVVAVRSGIAANAAGHELVGVVENMSWLETATGRQQLLGSGGGSKVAAELSKRLNRELNVISQIPISSALAESSDLGRPIVLSNTGDPAAKELELLTTVIAKIKVGPAARTLNVKLNS